MSHREPGQTRTVLLFTAWLAFANAVLIAISLCALLVSGRTSYGGPLVVIPLGFLLPALAIALPYAIFLGGWSALMQVVRGATPLVRWAFGGVTRFRNRDPFDF